MSVRKPLLCLDTNASIDIGARLNLSISLKEQIDDVHRALKNLYDDSLKRDIDKIYRERYDQLRGTSLFLDLVDGSSTIRIPKFVEIEHGRIRPYDDSLSKYPTEELTPDLHESSLDIFFQDGAKLAGLPGFGVGHRNESRRTGEQRRRFQEGLQE